MHKLQEKVDAFLKIYEASIPHSSIEKILFSHQSYRTDRYNVHHPYPENIFWVVEYSNSSLEKDLTVKPIIYATAEIPEYWVVNLKVQKVIVFRDPADGEYQQRQTYSQGSIAPLAFPNISIPINRLVE